MLATETGVFLGLVLVQVLLQHVAQLIHAASDFAHCALANEVVMGGLGVDANHTRIGFGRLEMSDRSAEDREVLLHGRLEHGRLVLVVTLNPVHIDLTSRFT